MKLCGMMLSGLVGCLVDVKVMIRLVIMMVVGVGVYYLGPHRLALGLKNPKGVVMQGPSAVHFIVAILNLATSSPL